MPKVDFAGHPGHTSLYRPVAKTQKEKGSCVAFTERLQRVPKSNITSKRLCEVENCGVSKLKKNDSFDTSDSFGCSMGDCRVHLRQRGATRWSTEAVGTTGRSRTQRRRPVRCVASFSGTFASFIYLWSLRYSPLQPVSALKRRSMH